MEIENKLDEDFVFYLGLLRPFLNQVTDEDVKGRCELWLEKLCGEACEGITRKRCRNIYLSQLIMCMQDEKLKPIFNEVPNDVDINNAFEVFQLNMATDEKPEWLNDRNMPEGVDHNARAGRTYLATRTLPNGQGAMAYIALSIGEDESHSCIGDTLDKKFEEEYRNKITEYEMEQILARRKDADSRERAIVYYRVLLDNITNELDGQISESENHEVTVILEQLVEDLKAKKQYDKYEEMDKPTRRIELLNQLHERVYARLERTKKREQLLDDIEDKVVSKSFFETTVLQRERIALPAHMWEQAINRAPSKKYVEKLHEKYPMALIEKFFELMSNYKELIAIRMQQRFEGIVAQMKREVQKEGLKGRRRIEIAQRNLDDAMQVYNVVQHAFEKKLEVEKANMNLANGSAAPEQTLLYEQLKAALADTQKSVEEEAERGRNLAYQINLMNEQSVAAKQINNDNMRKIEDANLAMIKNIKRLDVSIQQQQDRIEDLKGDSAKNRRKTTK